VAVPELRLNIVGGEPLAPDQVARWTTAGCRLLNLYGPTETTVAVVWTELTGSWDRPVPIGRPMANHRVCVVDDSMTPAQEGELLIGGPGVALGYLGALDLTAQRFVPDPFDPDGGNVYRTGDRVRWNADGQLEFLGRLDRQVKIRGQRLELGEVEAVLLSGPDIAQAAVLVADTAAGPTLVAFCTPADVDAGAVTAYCRQRLPDYMVPGQVIALARLPLTGSAKVDETALRARFDGPRAMPVAAPDDGVRAQVAASWARLLGSPPDADTDFVAAGGHSIVAMRLAAAVRANLNRALAVADVFTARTFGELADLVERLPAAESEPAATGGTAVLTAAQRRLWFLDQLAPDATAYNIGFGQRLHGRLDVGALRRALAETVRRHEVMRWRVADDGGHPVVSLAPPPSIDDVLGEAVGDAATALDALLHRRFDLERGPLWRAELLREGDDQHALLFAAHHAIFDGWSERPFLADLAAAYRDAAAPDPVLAARHHIGDSAAKTVQFGAYARWRSDRAAATGAADRKWWQARLDDAPHFLDLPRDRPRPAAQTYGGAKRGARLSPSATEAVHSLASRHGTISGVLLAAFATLLAEVLDGDDFVVGVPVADRPHEDFDDLVGFFVEIVPVRLRPDRQATFAHLIQDVAGELRQVVDHLTPLEEIVGGLRLPRDPGRSALVQVLFNVFNFPEPVLDLPGLPAQRLEPQTPGSPFDLTVYVVERGTLSVDFVYNPDLYDAARIERLLGSYVGLIETLVDDADQPVRVAAARIDPALRGGLVDRPSTELPTVVARAGIRPESGPEQAIAAIWAKVLDRSDIGVTDNFFDIGGTSLKLAEVRALLIAQFERDVPMLDLFQLPNIRALARHFDDAAGASDRSAASGITDRAAARVAARRDRSRRRGAPQPRPEGGTDD
jgi:acyl carrier protein